jgi:hypothetical protein
VCASIRASAQRGSTSDQGMSWSVLDPGGGFIRLYARSEMSLGFLRLPSASRGFLRLFYTGTYIQIFETYICNIPVCIKIFEKYTYNIPVYFSKIFEIYIYNIPVYQT